MASPENTQDEIAEWYAAFDEGDFSKSLSVAVKRYLEAEREHAQEQQAVLLKLIKISVKVLSGEFIPAESTKISEAETCSFCCNPLEDMFFVRGPNVTICADCIRATQSLVADTNSP